MRDREPRIVTSADDDPWQSAQQERALATLWPLLGRHIAFHRRLVDLTANVKAALLLSQSIYWTRHGRDIAQTGGWFLKTTEQWQMETGLSAREQSAAREVLRELAILNEQRVGNDRHPREQQDRWAVGRQSRGNLTHSSGRVLLDRLQAGRHP